MHLEKNQAEAAKTLSAERAFTCQTFVSQTYNTYPATVMTSVHHVTVGLTQARPNNIIMANVVIYCLILFKGEEN